MNLYVWTAINNLARISQGAVLYALWLSGFDAVTLSLGMACVLLDIATRTLGADQEAQVMKLKDKNRRLEHERDLNAMTLANCESRLALAMETVDAFKATMEAWAAQSGLQSDILGTLPRRQT